MAEVPPADGTPESVQVVDNPRQERYEAFVDGELAGVVTYRIHPGRIIFDHTEVDDSVRGPRRR